MATHSAAAETQQGGTIVKRFDVRQQPTRVSDVELFPLSAAQRATWFAQQLEPKVPISIAHYVELRGALDVDLLRRETRTVAREFQSPLLKVLEVDGQPMQYVDNSMEIPVELIDFRDCDDPMVAAHEWMQRDYQTTLDLGIDRLVETSVLCVGELHYLWYSRIHHVALDGFGAMTLMNRIAHRYSAAVSGGEPDPNRAAPLRKLYDIDSRYRSSDRFAADREYWAERNSGGTGSALATGHEPAVAASKLQSAVLSGESSAELLESEGQAATIIGALACYLARLTAKDAVLVQVPMSGRTTAVLRESGGMMVNVAPLSISVDEGDTVAELVSRVQRELMGALRHQRCSLEDIRRDIGVSTNGVSTNGVSSDDALAGPMVNVMMFRQEVQLGAMVGEYHIVTSGPVEDLLVNVYPSADQLFVDFRANPNRYADSVLRAHHGQFVELLEELIAAAPDVRLATIHDRSFRTGVKLRREAEQLEYWKNQLAGMPELLSLPSDRIRPAAQSLSGDRVDVRISADTHQHLIALAQEHNTTMFEVLHAGFALLTSRLSGVLDVVVGTPVSTGSNIVVLRNQVAPDKSFSRLLGQFVEVDAEAFERADIPFDRLVGELEVKQSPAYSPVVQVLFESGLERGLETGLETGTAAEETGNGIGRFDLRVSAEETFSDDAAPSGINVTLGFATDLFDADTVARLGIRYRTILEAVTADPETVVGDIGILSEDERGALLPVQTAPGRSQRTLPELFDAAARAHPDGIALSYQGASVTYRELDERSNQLARVLAARGIGSEDRVALGMTRSVESVLAMLAVAKSGAAFVPVDPTYPAERIQHMLMDSGAVVGLTVSAEQSSLPNSIPWMTLDDNTFRDHCAAMPISAVTDAERARPLRRENPAYVVYTSGSTGRPKGVSVTHTGLDGFAAEQLSRFGATPNSRTLHFSTPSFDASIFEYLQAFGAAATMVIAPRTIYGGEELARFLKTERVTHGFITTAALGSTPADGLPDFQDVVFGGEACPPELVQRWSPGRRLCNAYGPTEATIMANISTPMSPAGPITLGGPLRGCVEVVLDSRLNPVPDGVAGELYISGEALARGYHGKPALTTERFVASPFGHPGDRMYRTGDVVRRRGGTLEYVGRSDFQVKVRGFRIELGEIDTLLLAHPRVRTAVTVARTAPSGDTVLVSYVVPADGQVLSPADLTEYVGNICPRIWCRRRSCCATSCR